MSIDSLRLDGIVEHSSDDPSLTNIGSAVSAYFKVLDSLQVASFRLSSRQYTADDCNAFTGASMGHRTDDVSSFSASGR